jgi:hypothetical protein
MRESSRLQPDKENCYLVQRHWDWSFYTVPIKVFLNQCDADALVESFNATPDRSSYYRVTPLSFSS